MSVSAGQVWTPNHPNEAETPTRILVQRVARDGSWADIHVRQDWTGAEWGKRMALPFPDRWSLLGR